jgi:8-hydroxy-5-deazaflavin:NADPH oxidoreductase
MGLNHPNQHTAAKAPISSTATYAQAAEAPVVRPARFLRDGLLDTLEPLRRPLAGKLWIDITNPFNADDSDFILP